MNRSAQLARRAGYLLAALAGVLVLGASSEAQAVYDCLPSRNCRSVSECCRKPKPEFWLQVARAELRRDFYKSERNRAKAAEKGWDSQQAMENDFKDFIRNTQDAAAKRRMGITSRKQFGNVPGMTTSPETCKTTIDDNNAPLPTDLNKIFDDPNNPLSKENVCKEAVVAAIRHEQEHQDRCDAGKAGLITPKPATNGWARRELDESADKEQDGYAREAAVLRMYRRQARRRCSAAQKLENGDFENAKQRVQALKLLHQPRTW